MRCLKSQLFMSLACALVVLGICALVQRSAAKESDAEIMRKFPSLFNFVYYKQVFHKHYKSFVEELSRRIVFFPRVLQIIVSALRYIKNKQNYYLAVNQMTDFTRREFEQMNGKLKNWTGSSSELPPTTESHSNNSAIGNPSPVKAADSLTVANNQPPRQLSQGVLFASSTTKPKPRRKLSFSKQYKPTNTRMIGANQPAEKLPEFYDEITKLMYKKIHRDIEDGSLPAHKFKPASENDELYVDHSQGGCMGEPRDQGLCSSCYAFTTVAALEWLYCKKTGKLERLSEQYMMDCGKKFTKYTQLLGCDGGNFGGAMRFVRNFGAELEAHIPYRGRDEMCPLVEDEIDDLEMTGYLRFDGKFSFVVPYELWGEYVHYAPIYITIIEEGTDMKFYGGGLHDLSNCDTDWTVFHAMLLVGHGKQNGIEYWKIRNSYSSDWGESGYYRVPKIHRKCFGQVGSIFLSRSGLDLMLDTVKQNEKYNVKLAAQSAR